MGPCFNNSDTSLTQLLVVIVKLACVCVCVSPYSALISPSLDERLRFIWEEVVVLVVGDRRAMTWVRTGAGS